MSNAKKVLIVEGKYDEEFYKAVCQAIGLGPRITVAPPQKIGGNFNNKEGVFNHLPMMLQQLADGRIEQLALVVDADYDGEGGLGYKRTVQRVQEIVASFGYTIDTRSKKALGGHVFNNSDGLSDLGLWVMPNNQDDGMLEHWIKGCIIPNDSRLVEHSVAVVGALPDPKFKPIHFAKAEVSTWLAWQRIPGRGPEHAVAENLFDTTSIQYDLISKWLKHIYR
jgi:hypothetical protein